MLSSMGCGGGGCSAAGCFGGGSGSFAAGFSSSTPGMALPRGDRLRRTFELPHGAPGLLGDAGDVVGVVRLARAVDPDVDVVRARGGGGDEDGEDRGPGETATHRRRESTPFDERSPRRAEGQPGRQPHRDQDRRSHHPVAPAGEDAGQRDQGRGQGGSELQPTEDAPRAETRAGLDLRLEGRVVGDPHPGALPRREQLVLAAHQPVPERVGDLVERGELQLALGGAHAVAHASSFAICSAMRSPSMAELTMPPGISASLARRGRARAPTPTGAPRPACIRTGELVRLSMPMSFPSSLTKPRIFWSKRRSAALMRRGQRSAGRARSGRRGRGPGR